MKEDHFYLNIPFFTTFNEITNDKNFFSLPDSWNVVITDVKGSTLAIKEGRYREVNTVGAASIVVARKVMSKKEFPFIFGGDGATMLIPTSQIDAVLRELNGLKALAKQNFQLDLRVGKVKMSELSLRGEKIEVAKYEMSKGCRIAILRGEGVNIAEKLIKENIELDDTLLPSNATADLTGLTCRWKPIPSSRGRILSILIEAKSDKQNTYRKILQKLDLIFPEGIETLNPAITDLGRYKSITQCIRDEIRYQENMFSFSFFKRLIEIIPAFFVFNFNIPIPGIKRYLSQIETHSDFRKFDNMLRMVIDCSQEKIDTLKIYLDSLFQNGEIFYGLHESDCSLMTCFVEGINQGEHIHFMDAEGGGYTAAAIQLKDQMKKATTHG